MRVVVLRNIPGQGTEMLREQGYEVVVGEDVTGADAILSTLNDKITGQVMDKAGKQLKIVANYAVGFDNINLEAAKARNIFVTNTPGGSTQGVAEHTLALILAVAKHLVAADKFVREGKYKAWDPELFLGTQLAGKTLGVVGKGRIGSAVARAAQNGFGMKIICFDVIGGDTTLENLLKEADFVSLHVPLNDQTKHLISKPQLSMMKKTAILINTARGAIVNEEDLLVALKENWIAGAGLDVFESESTGINPEFYGLENVVLTPHTASSTIETRFEMSKMVAENIIAALSGEIPKSLVN